MDPPAPRALASRDAAVYTRPAMNMPTGKPAVLLWLNEADLYREVALGAERPAGKTLRILGPGALEREVATQGHRAPGRGSRARLLGKFSVRDSWSLALAL